MNPEPLPVLKTALRLLTFRITRDEILRLDNRHLIFGLLMTWLVGMGRSWDDPKAEILQHLGIGSVVYVFCLSLVLFLTARPITSQPLNYKQVLTFVCLVSPPGLLYAIPVEQFFSADVSRALNVTLLLIVASWRVGLLAFYLTRFLQFQWFEIVVVTMLPLALILAPLTAFNMLESIASAMGGLREGQQMSEPATQVLNFIGGLSCLALLPLFIAHTAIASSRKKYL